MRASAPFHILAKPFGARCNLECRYCFYLPKQELLADGGARMSDDVLEDFTRSYIDAQPLGTPEVEFAWQGGEPTLAGLDFFRRALELQRRYARSGMTVRNALQTNGVLLDDEWARFLRDSGFLVGLSLDGPRELHDAYRVDHEGRPTHERVVRALRLLRSHGVEFNVLTVVHALNSRHPRAVYDFLVANGVRFVQLIPLVEPTSDGIVSERTVEPRAWGEFLVGVFDRWLRVRHVGEVFVRDFDSMLASVLGEPGSNCVGARECGRCLALERTGDLFACDHYVDWEHHLGRLSSHALAVMVEDTRQARFGRAKFTSLPRSCRECRHLRSCWGGCRKDRIDLDVTGEPGLNHLCAGYQAFFDRALPVMQAMARCLRAGRPASEWDRDPAARSTQGISDRNAPCPCGSGRKFKRCCGA